MSYGSVASEACFEITLVMRCAGAEICKVQAPGLAIGQARLYKTCGEVHDELVERAVSISL